MSVLVFVEIADGKIKKAAYEAAYYAAKTAELTGTTAEAVVLGTAGADELANLGNFGITKIHHSNDARFNTFDSKAFAKAIAEKGRSRFRCIIVRTKRKMISTTCSCSFESGLCAGCC